MTAREIAEVRNACYKFILSASPVTMEIPIERPKKWAL